MSKFKVTVCRIDSEQLFDEQGNATHLSEDKETQIYQQILEATPPRSQSFSSYGSETDQKWLTGLISFLNNLVPQEYMKEELLSIKVNYTTSLDLLTDSIRKLFGNTTTRILNRLTGYQKALAAVKKKN